MPQDNAATIQVITRADDDGAQGSKSLVNKIELVTTTLDVDKLKQSFSQFVSDLQNIVDTKAGETNSFQLEQVLFSAEISASGQFKLLGTGVGVQGSSSITFILQRKEPVK